MNSTLSSIFPLIRKVSYKRFLAFGSSIVWKLSAKDLIGCWFISIVALRANEVRRSNNHTMPQCRLWLVFL